MEWLLIDGIGPFFHDYHRERINWSKIPFAHLETADGLKTALVGSIQADFERFVTAAAEIGCNAITLDDLAHLYPWDAYAAPLKAKIRAYAAWYGEMFAMATGAGLRVFITTDLMFYTAELARYPGRQVSALIAWWQQALHYVFQAFPAIAGIIMRFGEADARDVTETFRSALVLRTAKQVRQFLRGVLPVFERWQKLLVFRTWSVGVHAVGDLMWHHRTFASAFSSLHSPNLILSMKYGDSDFFRFLPLNAHFFQSPHQKIIEFQTRREYEGFGEYPAFVGWEYEGYLRALRSAPNVVGASLWCQTGGWGTFRRLTYLSNSSIWVELNTFVTAHMCRGVSCEQAVEQFCQRFQPRIPVQPFVQFLRLADETVKNLLYIPELAERQLFFRRLRVPPLSHVFWDRIVINAAMRTVLGALVTDRQRAIDEGRMALTTLDTMRHLAAVHHLPEQGLRLQHDTFAILALAREYLLGESTPELRERLQTLVLHYRATHAWRYTVEANFAPHVASRLMPSRSLKLLLRLMLREQAEYRWIDRLFLLRFFSLVYPLLWLWRERLFPAFARQHGMGIEVVFK
jgi:hypothetical protein